MTKRKHPTTANFTTLGLLAIVGFLGFLIIQIILEDADYNKEYEFNVKDISQSYVLTKIITTTENGIATVTEEKFDKRMLIDVIFTTTSFSAQNPIKVAVSVGFSDVEKNVWESDAFVDVNVLAFPGSYVYDEETSKPTNYEGVIKLNKRTSAQVYSGHGTIMYPFSGDFGYVMLDPNNAKLKNVVIENGIVVLSLEASDLEDKVLEKTKFPIESSDGTISLRMNNITQAISFIILLFVLIQLRPQIIGGVEWVLFDLPKHIFKN